MQPDQRQNLEDEYTPKLREFQQDYKNSRDELQQKDNEVTGAIVRDLAMVRKIGEKAGYTMVMEKGAMLWAVPGIDITDEVIRAYDAMNVKPGGLIAEGESEGAGRFRVRPTRARGGPRARHRSSASRRKTLDHLPIERTVGAGRKRRPRAFDAAAAASLSVPAGRPGAGARRRARPDAEERHGQRAVLPGPFPGLSGDAGGADRRGDGAVGARFSRSRIIGGRRRPLDADRDRQGALPPARDSRRSAAGWKCGCSSITLRCGRCEARRGSTASWPPRPRSPPWKWRGNSHSRRIHPTAVIIDPGRTSMRPSRSARAR